MTTGLQDQVVRDVMVDDVICLSLGDDVFHALDVMVQNGLSALPVVDEAEVCVGIVAAVDLLGTAYRGTGERSVREVMSSHPVVVDVDQNLLEAAAIMLQDQVHHLVVQDPKGRLVGFLSTMDVLQSFVDAADQL